MKLSSFVASLVILSAGSALPAQTPAYLETMPLSFLRAFAITTITSTTKAPAPLTPGTNVPLDPDGLRPDHRITTDIGAPLYYSEETGEQSFWVRQSQRAVLERIALQQQKRLQVLLADQITAVRALEALIDDLEQEIANATDVDQQTTLENQLAAAEKRLALQKSEIVKQTKALFASDEQLAAFDQQLKYAKEEFDDVGSRWELLAVREPQRSVEAAGRAPYKIFLGRIDRPKRLQTRTFDSGLRLQPYFSLGSATETLVNDSVTKAVGAGCTIVFEIRFDRDLDPATPLTHIDFEFAADPLHLVAKDNLALAEAGVDYNKDGRRLRLHDLRYPQHARTARRSPACQHPYHRTRHLGTRLREG